MLENRDIIVSSNEPWGDVWYSKQNYAYELSKRNNVYFLNPQSRWRPANLFDATVRHRAVSERLTVVDYSNPLPLANRLFFRINEAVVSRRLRAYFVSRGVSRPIYWAFDPYRLCQPRLFGAEITVFHVVDPYGFTSFAEESLCRNADLIFGITEELLPPYRRFGKQVRVVPHGISTDEFAADPRHPGVAALGLSNFALYVGNIDRKVDYGLLARMLELHPEVPFVFIGPLLDCRGGLGRDLFEGRRFGNLHHLGPVPYKELKHFVAAARFCLAINTVIARRNGIYSSHKVLQFLAQGKAVFQSIAERRDGLARLMYSSDSEDVLLASLDDWLLRGEDESLRRDRVDYARGRSFEAILGRVGGLFVPGSRATTRA